MGGKTERETDEEIVARALKEKEALAVLIERYQARLTRYIRRLGVRSEEDVEDILQNIFVKVYQHLNGFDTSLAFSSWVYRIAHNETMSFFRHQRVRPEGHMVFDGEEILYRMIDDTDVAQATEQALNAKQLSRALNTLDQKYRSVLVLRFFEERDYQEISDILKIPMGSVATLVHRAKKALGKELQHIA